MTQSSAASDLDHPLQRIASLVEELEQLPDTAARERARALVQAVLDIHRVGLARVLALAEAREGGASFVEELTSDQAVALLMSLHGLHPEDVETRVRSAVEALRPQLLEQGVAIELHGASEDSARVRLRPAGTVRASSARLRAAVEGAIYRSAPEIAQVEIDGLDDSPLMPAARLAEPRPKV